MALAGQAHVVIAIEPDFARPAGEARAERRDCGPLRGLRLLAAECAAHAPHLDRHGDVRHFENLGDEMLHLARVLGRAIDLHVAVFARNGERDLAFEIEMLLAADAQPAFDALFGLCERGGAVVLAERIVRQNVLVGRERIVDRHAMRPGRRLDLGKLCGAARFLARLRHHGEHDLTMKLDVTRHEDRVVARNGADIIYARNVGRRQHRDHAGRRAHRLEVHPKQLPGRDRCAADRDMQQPLGFADVIDEGGIAGDMLRRGIMPHRAAHDAQPHLLRAAVRQYRHRPPP